MEQAVSFVRRVELLTGYCVYLTEYEFSERIKILTSN
jgi:hypothetical protein